LNLPEADETPMKSYFLDKVSWEHSQALYHAAAYLRREALFILRPATPYICIGFHQDAEQEIDLRFARANQIPVFRREVGGGAVYLDSDQLFYQLILDKNRPEIPADKIEFYRRYLQPVVETYRAFGVDVEYKPVNDIIINGRKISGNGAAEIEGMLVLVGNFILDFNYARMSRSLRVPDEKFRNKVFKTLQDNLTTLRREAGQLPSTEELATELTRRYTPLLGSLLISRTVDGVLLQKAGELIAVMDTPEWLHANDRRRPHIEQVKIREGVYVLQNVLKTPGGLIRITAINDEGALHSVHISGDFFFYPAETLPGLEIALEGIYAEFEAVTGAIESFYAQTSVESPGVQPADFARALVQAA
jgi:lipoate-protein ligase A